MSTHSLYKTRRSCACQLFYRPLEGGPAKAGGNSASKLSFTMIPYPTRKPDSPAKGPDKYQYISIYIYIYIYI